MADLFAQPLAIAALIVISAVAVELWLGLRPDVTANRLLGYTGKSVRVMGRKGASDHWKERAMMGYARATFRTTGLLVVQLGAILLAAGLMAWGASILAPGLPLLLISLWGLVVMGVAATVYIAARKSLRHAFA